MLKPPNRRREKILTMGSYGTGKTTSWLNVAKWSAKTGSDSRFFALDTDGALEAFMEGNTQYSDLGNIEYATVFEFPQYQEASDKFRARMTDNDWFILDFAGNVWDAVQEYYVAQIYKADMDDYFMDARKAMKKGTPLEGWQDWPTINKLYAKFMNDIIHRTPGHKFFTAQIQPIGDTDSKENKLLFGPYGVRPKGQKMLGHAPHTVLLYRAVKQGEIFVTTIKDRERSALEGAPMHEFAIDYLCKVGGWTL